MFYSFLSLIFFFKTLNFLMEIEIWFGFLSVRAKAM